MPDEQKVCEDQMEREKTIQPLSMFQVPSCRRDTLWLSGANDARKELDKVWSNFTDDYVEILRAHGCDKADTKRCYTMLSQLESHEGLQDLAVEKQRILLAASTRSTKEDAPFIEYPQDHGQFEKVGKLQPKPKMKTRPLSDNRLSRKEDSETVGDVPQGTVVSMDTGTPTPMSTRAISPTKYALKPKSLRAMCLIFASGAADRGSLNWLDFVILMGELRFAAEHRGGSVFTCKSSHRSMNVHRPHTSIVMGPVQLRGIGQRFSRRFGWERQNFELV